MALEGRTSSLRDLDTTIEEDGSGSLGDHGFTVTTYNQVLNALLSYNLRLLVQSRDTFS
jgi:hypothetical protein